MNLLNMHLWDATPSYCPLSPSIIPIKNPLENPTIYVVLRHVLEGHVSKRVILVMEDVNATGVHPQGREILHGAETTLVILTASEQRRRSIVANNGELTQ